MDNILKNCKSVSLYVPITQTGGAGLNPFVNNTTLDNKDIIGVAINTAAKTSKFQTKNTSLIYLVLADNDNSQILLVPEYMVDLKTNNYILFGYDGYQFDGKNINWTASGIYAETAGNFVEVIFFYRERKKEKC
jgi:hypothetical protein